MRFLCSGRCLLFIMTIWAFSCSDQAATCLPCGDGDSCTHSQEAVEALEKPEELEGDEVSLPADEEMDENDAEEVEGDEDDIDTHDIEEESEPEECETRSYCDLYLFDDETIDTLDRPIPSCELYDCFHITRTDEPDGSWSFFYHSDYNCNGVVDHDCGEYWGETCDSSCGFESYDSQNRPLVSWDDEWCTGRPRKNCFTYTWYPDGSGYYKETSSNCNDSWYCEQVDLDENGNPLTIRGDPNCDKTLTENCRRYQYENGHQFLSYWDEGCDEIPDRECNYKEFDDEGRLVFYYSDSDCDSVRDGRCWKYTYNERGQETSWCVLEDCEETVFCDMNQYDDQGRLILEYRHYGDGLPARECHPIVWSADGLSRSEFRDRDCAGPDEPEDCETTTYDDQGRVKTQKSDADCDGEQTIYESVHCEIYYHYPPGWERYIPPGVNWVLSDREWVIGCTGSDCRDYIQDLGDGSGGKR